MVSSADVGETGLDCFVGTVVTVGTIIVGFVELVDTTVIGAGVAWTASGLFGGVVDAAEHAATAITRQEERMDNTECFILPPLQSP